MSKEKNRNNLFIIGIIIIVLGVIAGSIIVYFGFSGDSKRNKKLMAQEREKLLEVRTKFADKVMPVDTEINEIEKKYYEGVQDTSVKKKIDGLKSSIKEDKEALEIVDYALDDTFDNCGFSKQKKNKYTKDYCYIKNRVNGKYDKLFFITGSAVIVLSVLSALIVFVFSKGKNK